jgi:hypothetical protein
MLWLTYALAYLQPGILTFVKLFRTPLHLTLPEVDLYVVRVQARDPTLEPPQLRQLLYGAQELAVGLLLPAQVELQEKECGRCWLLSAWVNWAEMSSSRSSRRIQHETTRSVSKTSSAVGLGPPISRRIKSNLAVTVAR